MILDASRVVTRSGFFISDFFLTFPRLKSQISLTFYYLYPTIKVRGDLWMVFLKTLSLEEIHILDVTCLRYVLLILDAWSAMPKSVYTVVFIFPYSAHKFIPLLTNNIFFLDFPHIFRYWHKFPWHFQVFPDRGIFSLTCNSPAGRYFSFNRGSFTVTKGLIFQRLFISYEYCGTVPWCHR